MLLRRSRISTCCFGDPEFCRSAEAVGKRHVDTAVKDFAIFIPSSSFAVLLRLWRSSPLCCGCQEFRHVAKSGISPCCFGGREFSRVGTAVGNFAVLLDMSGV